LLLCHILSEFHGIIQTLSNQGDHIAGERDILLRPTEEIRVEPILTRCGCRCDLCLAYRPNVENSPENREKLSDGWQKYFGFRIPASEICCDGCMADSPSLDQACPVRPCVIERGLDNCSQCESYVCEKLRQRLVTYEEIARKTDGEIPEQDYLCFIKPYENKKRLDAQRSRSRAEGE
jgi:hypothetical protein